MVFILILFLFKFFSILTLTVYEGHDRLTHVRFFVFHWENAAIFRYGGVNAANAANAVNLQAKRR